jgi:hypothetical protein
VALLCTLGLIKMLALAFVFHVFESNRVSNSAGSGTVWHMRTHAGDGSPCTAADRTGAWMVAPKTGLVMKADGNERKIALPFSFSYF